MTLDLAQTAELAKAAHDVANAQDVGTMKTALLFVVGSLAVFFFWKWQTEVAESRAEDKNQIKLFMEAGAKKEPTK